MNNVDNSKRIILLSQLSRYNPMYEVTGEREIEIFNRYNGEKSLEARKAYDELILKKRVPFNREYVDFYKKAIDTKPEDLTLLLDSHTVNQMIGTREIVEEMVNSILAVESLFKRFLIVDDAYVLADKLDAVNYYCDNIDDAYKELKDLGYNNGDFESARLNWLNKTYPALQKGLADSHSTFKKEGAYNNFTSQLYYWEKILYGE